MDPPYLQTEAVENNNIRDIGEKKHGMTGLTEIPKQESILSFRFLVEWQVFQHFSIPKSPI
ncbi:hypothetical protein ACRALDRAFT_206856 [Sodiomyces alcalophilus JCM 7366]|uniref:uncharacterized protein n=1 Tax=Sodiomyces alcalophilus JCM 7366 TaxID=591952 RepID=UPI0039B5DBE8